MKDLYFKDEATKYIFYLVELTGSSQLELLGISYIHYRNRAVADTWYKKIIKITQPCIGQHPKTTEAMQVLEKLYKGMTE